MAKSGLVHTIGRAYHPRLGLFTAADPTTLDASHLPSLNRYAFADGNPLTKKDPLGYMAEHTSTDAGAGQQGSTGGGTHPKNNPSPKGHADHHVGHQSQNVASHQDHQQVHKQPSHKETHPCVQTQVQFSQHKLPSPSPRENHIEGEVWRLGYSTLRRNSTRRQ